MIPAIRASSCLLFGLLLMAAGSSPDDELTLPGDKNFLTDFTAEAGGGFVHAVVEIPSGTNAKWEVDKKDGKLRWELEDGQPRVVEYLSYPANYGMIPRTLLAAEMGGDGDPLDVLVLGPALKRGAVVRVRLLGLLSTEDDGEKDDKLLAVAADSPFAAIRSIEELDEHFAGVTTILETWFSNYKGPGRIRTRGYQGADAALALVRSAAMSFDEQR